jgi:hypothetical protein
LPKKYSPSKEEVFSFESMLFERGFRRMTPSEIEAGLPAAPGLQRKFYSRRDPGFEAGYLMEKNGLQAVVWTTWLDWKEGVRNMDAGWVLIRHAKKTEQVYYYSRPLNRTKGYLGRLLKYVRRAAWRVRHRPQCPQCDRMMRIAFGKGYKSRYWTCPFSRSHIPMAPIHLDWDCMFTPEQKQELSEERRVRKKYRQKRTDQGKENFLALKKRSASRRHK